MIAKKKLVAVAFDLDKDIIIVYANSLSQELDVHLFQKAQIAFLKTNKTFISISTKYANFANIFSKNLVAKLPEHNRINDYAINLIEE